MESKGRSRGNAEPFCNTCQRASKQHYHALEGILSGKGYQETHMYVIPAVISGRRNWQSPADGEIFFSSSVRAQKHPEEKQMLRRFAPPVPEYVAALTLQRSRGFPSGVAGGNTMFTYTPRSKSPFHNATAFSLIFRRTEIMGLGSGPRTKPISFSR